MHPSIKNSINKTRVLQEVRKSHGISRVEIASNLGLDKSTISKITSDLLEQGLILDKKSDEGLKQAGRRRIGLELNILYGVVIGIEIQTEYYNIVVMNLRGEILQNFREVLPNLDLLQSIELILDSSIDKYKKDYTKILGIGIGIPGHVDPDKGIILQSNPLNIKDPLYIYAALENKYECPIFIDNDANCCCWGELTFREGKVDNNFLVALGETRLVSRKDQNIKSIIVGLGIVINGKVLIGDGFSAGEFKSLFWKDSPLSQFSLDSTEADLIPEDREKTVEVIEELLKHIALFINTFNFTKIVFAGVFNDYKVDIRRILNRQVEKNWGYESKPNIGIEFTSFGDYDVSYGAGGMIVEKLFTTPDISNSDSFSGLKGIDLFNYISKDEISVYPGESDG